MHLWQVAAAMECDKEQFQIASFKPLSVLLKLEIVSEVSIAYEIMF